MGIVFEARQRRLDRRVAIKILRPELATAVAAERFLAEGRILARLSHPNIVPIYDAGEADGLLYYVMEFVEGESLADRLRRGPLPPAEALRLSQDLLAALGAAHAQGVVHRDVKPANIFLRQGQALLGDFGIARWRQEHDAGLTTPGELIGTPRYMSPEQRDGVPVTMRTDVYAAGLVLWEACTGKRWPAYQAPETADWGRVPAALVPPLRRALALTPEERWSDAGELLQALGQSRRRPRWPLVATGAVLAAGLGWALPAYDAMSLERVSRRVASDSAGIPFLAVELLSAVAQGLDLKQGTAAWPAPSHTLTQTMPSDLPDTVVAALRIGFRRLGEDARQVLAAAAVLGGRTTEASLTQATGLPAARVEAALDELEWQRWLEADGQGYAFVASVARQVVARDMMTPGQQARVRQRSGLPSAPTVPPRS
jgi:hypothetical protein